jgi:hypothetical protein
LRGLTVDGLRFISRLSRPDASSVGRHWNAVRHYLETGDDSALAEFDAVQVSGVDEHGQPVTVQLETDPDAVELQALRGDLSFESIYDEML